MQHFTMLVTPDGEWVSPDSPEFFAALGDPNPDYDAVAFAVKNLGFIKFQVIQHSIVEIELHPRNVELPALCWRYSSSCCPPKSACFASSISIRVGNPRFRPRPKPP